MTQKYEVTYEQSNVINSSINERITEYQKL